MTYMMMRDGYTLEAAKDSVGKGWEKLIEKAFELKPDSVKIVQVKEKFGGLRIYFDTMYQDAPVTKESNFAVYLYQQYVNLLESLSYTICEWCGKRGTVDTQNYWILTLCPSCKRKRTRRKNAERAKSEL